MKVHTAGSAAYLFRGILFTGDALARTALDGFTSALPAYSDDAPRGAASLATLLDRVAPYEVT